jgi:hypothetical protein
VHICVDDRGRCLGRTLAVGLIILTFSAALESAASAAGATTASVLSSARSAIAGQASAHVVFTAHSGNSNTTEKIIADVSSTGGTETVFEGSADVAIRVTPAFAYVSGTSSGLTTLFGMSAASAKRIGRDWESWKSGSSQYRILKNDLTMSSVSALLPKASGTTLTTTRVHGAQMYVLKWTTGATDSVPKLSNTLTISAGGQQLPMTKTSTASGGTSTTTVVSQWGEAVIVRAPPNTSTIASSQISH